MPYFIPLPERRVVALSGPDCAAFLQGLVSNDVTRLSSGRGVYAALLSPQGKILFDFLMAARGESILLDCEAARADDLVRRLTMYRLRAQVEISFMEDWAVATVINGEVRAPSGGIAFPDPRHPGLGTRILAPDAVLAPWGRSFEEADDSFYQQIRLELGVPEGTADFGVESTLALEGNLDLLNGVDFAKGCYVGQELTARTHYRGKVRYRFYPVDIEGADPDPGSDVMKDDRKVGVLVESADGIGLARLRSEDMDGTPLSAGDSTLTARPLAGAGA